MDAVAITGFVVALVAAVASLAGVVLKIRHDRGRQREQDRLARENELRDVLDRGGDALTAALYAFDRRRAATPEKREVTGEDFNDKVEAVEVISTRIAQRIGEDEPAAQSYRGALKSLDDLRELAYEAGERFNPEKSERANYLKERVVTLRSEYLKDARSRIADLEADKRANPEA
jgi:hypothetical protein